jgi:hypothetical protein
VNRKSIIASNISFLVSLLLSLFSSLNQLHADREVQPIAIDESLEPWLQVIRGENKAFELMGWAEPKIDDEVQRIDFRLTRYDDQSFDLDVTHTKYAIKIRRRADATSMCLPKHEVVFEGHGAVDPNDHLATQDVMDRLISHGSIAKLIATTITTSTTRDLVAFIESFATLEQMSDDGLTWSVDEKHELTFGSDRRSVEIRFDDMNARLELVTLETNAPPKIETFDNYKHVTIERLELEKQLARGVKRTFEVLAPAPVLTSPPKKEREVANGELKWIEGQRVCLLHGTPEEIGTAHGELLKQEAIRCIDSVLYAFGTAQTIATGRWFRYELDAAYEKLEPHIPERHKQEARSLAASLNVSPDLMESLNVFPELFHCSGFALFGDATADGKLYHGRVLDYMTTIGLQDAATTFVVAPQGMIPFANVGYAGFVGSVSGMNAQHISLGEMGGRGEGQWDGVPMATLMRRALEECDSLDEVKQLWADSPRTCEYFYVFADGETKTAVGVSATPQNIEFVLPGAAHPRLGEGIDDAVVLSAGSRLEELRRRVKEGYGKFDADSATQLMCRPVAMTSNLHNVLFVPEDRVFYVANASHDQPAADRPYVKLDLMQLLGKLPANTSATTADVSIGNVIRAVDTLAVDVDSNADAQACLTGLRWTPTEFDVHIEAAMPDHGDAMIRFASPRPSGNAQNDLVAVEWYQARNDKSSSVTEKPAVVVIHESGKGMHVGRLIASQLRNCGIHAFMVQLPYYGVRRPPEGKAKGSDLINAIQQAVADVRRTRDAVAAIPGVNDQQISLQGTSLGGFVTATVAGLDRSYDNVFVFLAGGNLYQTLMEGEKDAAKVREELTNSGLSEDEIRTGLNAIEPLRLAHRLDPKHTWVFSGTFDNVVTPTSSSDFAKAAGLSDSHHVKMFANHYSGIVYLPTVLWQISEVIKR